jgi:epoxyqueuosine reductase
VTGQVRLGLDELRSRAADLGLEAGASAAEPGPEAGRLKAWLRRGDQAGMGWLERDPERRADPRRVLSGARSVVSVGLPHGVQTQDAPRDRPRGRIARFALGDDYHDLLLPRVRLLAEALGDPEARPYVDTGSVMEKPRAERAGLGWVGKHTNTVSRRHGSWWLLGAVITKTEVEPSVPHEDHCGSCVRCLGACPSS